MNNKHIKIFKIVFYTFAILTVASYIWGIYGIFCLIKNILQ